ncbi:MAG: hypothetical protein JWQ58_319 [Reyranella sp.]|nr:hypothetical protein [Reyranella sp.]
MRSLSTLMISAVASIVSMLGTAELRAATLLPVASTASPALFARNGTAENPTFRLTGMIETGDAEKLRDVLVKLQASAPPKAGMPLATIELSSLGGSLPEGVRIGELLKSFKVVAVVRKQDLCLSACALALLGGNTVRPAAVYPVDCNVEVGGKVAFHNFFLDRTELRGLTHDDPVASRLQGFADARGGAAMLIKYAADMGLPPSFVANLMARPVEEFQYIETIGEFLELKLCPIGLERPSLPMSHQAANICNNSLAESVPLSSFVVGPIATPQVRQYMLERVQDGMNAAKAKGRLADQLATWSVMRSKDEVDKLYDDLRAAGVALPEILGPTFEVSINQGGRYRAACYVSLSATDPDRYDVVLQGARSLAEVTRVPPANARRMFLYDRRDVANQRPSSDMRDLIPDSRDIEDTQAAPLSSGRVPKRGDAPK